MCVKLLFFVAFNRFSIQISGEKYFGISIVGRTNEQTNIFVSFFPCFSYFLLLMQCLILGIYSVLLCYVCCIFFPLWCLFVVLCVGVCVLLVGFLYGYEFLIFFCLWISDSKIIDKMTNKHTEMHKKKSGHSLINVIL